MDPVTQATLGAVFAQSSASAKQLGKAAIIGALAGMAADLDVLIRSDTDPLFALEFHRHFTHSLLFIPFAGLLCALVLHPLLGKRWQLTFWTTLLWCVIGYATHGLLDACTSYGTQLLWPLSNQRFAWDTISIIDPLFTLPLLALVVVAARLKSKRWVWLGLLWGALYMSLGFVQHERALRMGKELAAQRGHTTLSIEAKPSFANLLVWKVIYATPTHYHVDAVRPGWRKNAVWPGSSIAKLDVARDLPWLDPLSQQAKDLERFRWFSMGFIALDPGNPQQIIDMRYSMLPHQIDPLWGIRLDPQAGREQHVEFITLRGDGRGAFKQLLGMVLGRDQNP